VRDPGGELVHRLVEPMAEREPRDAVRQDAVDGLVEEVPKRELGDGVGEVAPSNREVELVAERQRGDLGGEIMYKLVVLPAEDQVVDRRGELLERGVHRLRRVDQRAVRVAEDEVREPPRELSTIWSK